MMNKNFYLIKSSELIALENTESSQEITLIALMLDLIKAYGNLAIDVLNHTKNVAKSFALIEENYDGTYNSPADFIRDYMKNDLDDYIAQYVDFDQMAADFLEDNFLKIDGTEGKIHIFYT